MANAALERQVKEGLYVNLAIVFSRSDSNTASVGFQRLENDLGFRHPSPLESSAQTKVALLATTRPQYSPVQLPRAGRLPYSFPFSFNRCLSQLLPLPRPRNSRVLRCNPRRWRRNSLVATFPGRSPQVLARSYPETTFLDPSYMGSSHSSLIPRSHDNCCRPRPRTINHGSIARPPAREPSL
jgi:hypothetical protein